MKDTRELRFKVPIRVAQAVDSMRENGQTRTDWLRGALDDFFAANPERPRYRMKRSEPKTAIYVDLDPDRDARLRQYQEDHGVGLAGTVLRLAVVWYIRKVAAEAAAREAVEKIGSGDWRVHAVRSR